MRYYIKMKQKISGIFNKTPKIIVENIPFLVVLTIICWATFATVLDNGFVSDDIAGFVKSDVNHYIGKLLNFKEFSISRLTWAISYQLFGLSPTPLHILAITTHNLNCILIFFLAIKIFKNKRIGYITASLFCVHPIVTEPVNWISGRQYLFHTTVVLINMLLYLEFRKKKDRLFLYGSVLFFGIGLFIQRSAWALILPFLIVTAELFFLKPWERAKKLTKRIAPLYYFLPMVIFVGTSYYESILTRFHFMRTEVASPTGVTTGEKPSYINRIAYTIGSATKLLFYPKDLSLYHEGEPVGQYFILFGLTVLAISTLLIIYWIKKRHYKKAGLLSGIYLALAPALSPIQVSWYIADRYLYLPALFFVTLLALTIESVTKSMKIKNIALYLTLVIMGFYIYKDIRRNADWQNRKTLWEATARTNPYSPRVYNNLGDVYGLEGNTEKSIQSFQRAIQLEPNYPEAMYNLGNAYKQAGEVEKGDELMQEALKLKPNMLE